jgi:hypothetical protein
MLDDRTRVEAFPGLVRLRFGEFPIELDEHIDELASYRRSAEDLRQLGQTNQPVRIPRRPVGVVAVDDSINEVMRFASLM